jgi:hypothetical protein
MEIAKIMIPEFNYSLPVRKNILHICDVFLPQCIPERRYDHKG